MSPETQFLVYVTKYLKLVACDWTEFVQCCQKLCPNFHKHQHKAGHSSRDKSNPLSSTEEVELRSKPTSASNVVMSRVPVENSAIRLVDYSSDDSSCDDDLSVKSHAQQPVRTPVADTQLLTDVMSCLFRTSLALDKINASRELVAFDLRPLIRLFQTCDDLNESMTSGHPATS